MKSEIKADRIVNFLAAGYAGFLIRTTESKRAAEVITELIEGAKRKDSGGYNVVQWDMDSAKKKDPKAPLVNLSDDAEDLTIALLHNYHWWLDQPAVIQKIQNDLDIWKNQGKALVILSPFVKIPLEIRKDFMVLELPLPSEEEIRGCMHHIANSANKPELLEGSKEENEAIVQAAKGLTKTEIENVLALSYTEKACFDVKTINEQKIQTIEKSGLIEVLKTDKSFDDILGYDKIKNVVGKMIVKRTAKGVLIVGPPGCGKTEFMKCACGQFDKIGLIINFGRLYSKYQGEGSENVEAIIDIIEAVGDCVVIMDEFEKQFSGAASSGDTDSGVARRMTGRWLQFMQEKPEGVYMMGTCNSFDGVPDEYLRPGRWDSSPFYIDLPTVEEQKLILDYYVNKLDLPADVRDNGFDMKNWTGAEIEAMCDMARNLECTLAEAAKYIIPMNKRGFAKAEELKDFAIAATTFKAPKRSRRMDT